MRVWGAGGGWGQRDRLPAHVQRPGHRDTRRLLRRCVRRARAASRFRDFLLLLPACPLVAVSRSAGVLSTVVGPGSVSNSLLVLNEAGLGADRRYEALNRHLT